MQDHDLTPAEKRLRLLKQGKKGLFHLIFSRTGIMTLLILLQLGLMLLMVLRFQDYLIHYYGLFTLLSVATVLFLLNSDSDPNAKITWLLLVSLFPAAGAQIAGQTGVLGVFPGQSIVGRGGRQGVK